MEKLLFTIILSLFITSVFCQVEETNGDSIMNNSMTLKNTKMKSLSLTEWAYTNDYGDVEAKAFYAKQPTCLFSSMDRISKPVKQIKCCDRVFVLDTFNVYYVVKHADSIAFALRVLYLNQEEFNVKEETRKKKEELLIELFGDETTMKILNKEIWIGMTNVMANYSWGKPTRIIRNQTGGFGVNEQWIYGYGNNKLYLNFDNGLLTSWHD